MIADENPSYFDPFIEMENLYSFVKSIDEHEPRKIYRYNRTAYEVKHNIKYPELKDCADDCAEECGSIISDYVSKPIERTLFNV